MKNLVCTFLILVLVADLKATNHIVTSKSDDEVNPVEGMLRYEIENAADGDTIVFEVDTVFLDAVIRIEEGVLTIDGGTGVILDGNNTTQIFNITCYFSSDSINIRNLTIQNGKVEDASAMGGGMYAYIDAGNLQVDNCTFKNNNVISGGDGQGGALRTYGGNFYNCFFLNNEVSGTTSILGGGAVYSVGGFFVNCVIAGNKANYGGGMYSSGSTLFNCTFTLNSVETATNGGGISSDNQTKAINCIFYNNLAGGVENNVDDYDGIFSTCAVETGNSFAGNNNNIGLTETPFKDSGADSLSLKEGSVCIDSGDPLVEIQLDDDIAGYNRMIGLSVDIGAYEFHAPHVMSDDIVYTNGGYFYDSGGEDANYLRNDYTMTFYPDTDGKILRFIFEEFLTGSTSHILEIYDGTSTHAQLIGSYKRTSNPDTITATNADGALTFSFITSTGGLASGWKAAIQSITPVVTTKPTAYFAFDTTSSATPLSVLFKNYSRNYPNSWYWDFGDGTTSTEYNPVHDYDETGIYFVTLVATNAEGTDTIIRSVKTADVDDILMSNQQVTTDLGLFYDSGGEHNIYDFGESYTITFLPATPGKVMEFIFEYFNTTDYTFTVDYYLHVYDGTSTSSPLIGRYEGVSDIDTITATNVDGAITFEFNSAEHIYPEEGWKAAVFAVDRISNEIPVAHFSSDTVSAEEPLTIKFIESSRYNPTSWKWDFDDGTTSDERNPVHIYDKTGIYYVTLVAFNTEGSDTLIKSIKTADVADYFMNTATYSSDLGYFYDSGGEDDTYLPNENYTVTFYPASTGNALQFNFEEFVTGYWTHTLEIFDGTSTGATKIGAYSETSSPGTIVATNPDGALTFRFTSSYSGFVDFGWKAAFVSLPYYTINFSAYENGYLLGNEMQTVLGTYSSETITAIPDEGYHFVEWQNATGDSVSNENPMIVSNVNQDSSLIAIFEKNNYNLTFVAGENGYLTGNTEQIIQHGNSATAVTAVAENHFHFVEWQNAGGDSITNENPVIITNPIKDTILFAVFNIDNFNASFLVGEKGSLNGITEQNIDYDSSGTAVEAIANNHYHFVEWQNTSGDSISNVNPLVITNIKTDTSLTAVFEVNEYHVQFLSEQNGVLEGVENQNVVYDENTSEVSAVPNTGYYFLKWQNTDGDSITNQNPIVINNVDRDTTLTAVFKKLSYYLVFTPWGNGNLTGATLQIIEHGENASEVLAVPDNGYHFVEWQNVNGDSITNENPLTVTNVLRDTSLIAIFDIGMDPTSTEIVTENKLLIYPNPVKDKFTIQSEIQNGYFTLVSMSGVTLREAEIRKNNLAIDISNLPNEVYILNIYTEEWNRQFLIVKNH